MSSCLHPPRECDWQFLGWGLAFWLAVNGAHGDAAECMDFFDTIMRLDPEGSD